MYVSSTNPFGDGAITIDCCSLCVNQEASTSRVNCVICIRFDYCVVFSTEYVCKLELEIVKVLGFKFTPLESRILWLC